MDYVEFMVYGLSVSAGTSATVTRHANLLNMSFCERKVCMVLNYDVLFQ